MTDFFLGKDVVRRVMGSARDGKSEETYVRVRMALMQSLGGLGYR